MQEWDNSSWNLADGQHTTKSTKADTMSTS